MDMKFILFMLLAVSSFTTCDDRSSLIDCLIKEAVASDLVEQETRYGSNLVIMVEENIGWSDTTSLLRLVIGPSQVFDFDYYTVLNNDTIVYNQEILDNSIPHNVIGILSNSSFRWRKGERPAVPNFDDALTEARQYFELQYEYNPYYDCIVNTVLQPGQMSGNPLLRCESCQ